MITERIDNITNIPEEYRKAELPAPRSVKIELTGKCNYRCSYCAHQQKAEQSHMDMTLYRLLVSEIARAGVQELGVFYLGESFLAPSLTDAIAFAKAVGIPYVFLTTNGSVATPDKVEAAMRAGLDSLKFSLNYADEAQFEDIANVNSKYYRKAIENVKAALDVRDRVHKETGHWCGLFASSIRYDGEQQAKMEAVVRDIRPFVDEHYELPLYSMATMAAQREAELGYRPTAGNQGRLNALRTPIPCWSCFTEGHISSDGTMSACCFGNGPNDSLVMADLRYMEFMDGWNSKPFKRLREAHLRGDVTGTVCESCLGY